MKAEITFDTFFERDDHENAEGCYRLPGRDWQVFYFTKWYEGEPEVHVDSVWASGITGVQVHFPLDQMLNPDAIKRVLGETLGVTEWAEVPGPNSLLLK